MQLAPQELEPLKELLRLIDFDFKVHEVPLETEVLRDGNQLARVKQVAFLSLAAPIRFKVNLCSDETVHENFCLLLDPLKDEGAKHLDTVLVRDIDPAGWRDGHPVVPEVDEGVNVLPVGEAVLVFLRLELRLALEDGVASLRELIVADAGRNVMANDHFALSGCQAGLVGHSRLVHFEVFRLKQSYLVVALDEEELICVRKKVQGVICQLSLGLLRGRISLSLFISCLTDLEVSYHRIEVIAGTIFTKGSFGALELCQGNSATLFHIRQDLAIDGESEGVSVAHERQPHLVPAVKFERPSPTNDIMILLVAAAQDHLDMVVGHDSELKQ